MLEVEDNKGEDAAWAEYGLDDSSADVDFRCEKKCCCVGKVDQKNENGTTHRDSETSHAEHLCPINLVVVHFTIEFDAFIHGVEDPS